VLAAIILDVKTIQTVIQQLIKIDAAVR